MKIEIDSYGPIVCGIELTKTFRNYEGGVFSETTVSPKIDHYVEVLGYSGNDYWIGRSFFGTAWGISGYFKMKMGSANLGIETKCLYAGATL